jgi:spore coat polysaccharide biosynthesis predicted glycosyltransferase SpsG/RimJ/RimL family protein N-acetyltransferase
MAIAEEAIRLGISVRFIHAQIPGSLTREILKRNFEDIEIPYSVDPESWNGINPEWGVNLQTHDASAVGELLSSEFTEHVLVDHYGLTKTWSQEIQKYITADRVLFIHDQVEALEEVNSVHLGFIAQEELLDRVLDPIGLGVNDFHHLSSFVPMSRAIRLAKLNSTKRDPKGASGEYLKVFIFLSNSDVEFLMTKLRDAIEILDLKEKLRISILQTPEFGKTKKRLDHKDFFEWVTFSSQSDYIDYMIEQDFVIGAGGVASLERLFLQIPQVVFTIADNQLENARALSSWGILEWLGDLRELPIKELATLISSVLEKPSLLWEKATNGALFVDGLGSRRIVQLLTKSKITNLIARPADLTDASTLYLWNNDIQSRRNSITKSIISPNSHYVWFEKYILNPAKGSRIFVIEDSYGPIGQVRFDAQQDGTYLLSYGIDFAFRGQSLGKEVLALGLKAHKMRVPEAIYKAMANRTNLASTHTLESLSFREVENHGEFIEYELK